MRRFVTIVGLVLVAGTTAQAQVIWDSGNGPNTSFRPQGDKYAAEGFTFAVSQVLTQFGFYGQTDGGIFKFFIADATNNVIHSDIVTLAAAPNPTLLLSDVFSLALGPGTYAFGIIGQNDAELQENAFFTPISLTQNGVTNLPANENWSDFNSPTRGGDGAATIAMQLRTGSVVATPEPTSLVLTATGLAGLVAFFRRRRLNQA